MLRLLLLGLQTETSLDHWSLTTPTPALDLRASHPCPRDGAGDDVVVCGHRDPDAYRLRPLPPGYEQDPALPMAQTRVGGRTLGMTTQQVMIGNVPSNRVMVTLKLPF